MRDVRKGLFRFLLSLCCSAVAQAQPAPFHHYRTLETEHFNAHVTPDLEREGRVAAAYAERAYAQLSRELHTPRGRIDLVVSDDADYSNGFASVSPSNRIVIFATPPTEGNSLRLNEDWLQLVVTHELTHIFHLDRVGGVWALAQHIFGRGAGLFPNAYGPSWLTEGLAVYYESRLTEGGRLHDSEHRLIARAAAEDKRFPSLGDLSLGSPLFPAGERAYAFGSLFVDYLAKTHGDTGIRKLIDSQSATLIPFRLDHEARQAFGISFHDAYDIWRDSIDRSTHGFQTPYAGWRELTHHPYYASDARWVNDSTLIYAANDGRSTTAEYSLDLQGNRRRIGRRNNLEPSTRMPDGSLLFAQLDFERPDVARSDLYVERDGKQTRLTHGLRLVQPDVNRDGMIVAVQLAAGRTSLMLLNAQGRQQRMLRTAGADETWTEPRWSPDGTKVVAVHRIHGGIYSIDVLDVASNGQQILVRATWLLASPAFTFDGGAVLFTSEQSGEPRLSAARLNDGRTVILSAVFGDMYSPVPSPNGSKLALTVLRSDGFHLGVMDASGALMSPALDAPPVATPDVQPLAPGTYHDYSAWASVFPTSWYPLLEDAPNGGTRLGATFSSHDVLRRHTYDGYLATTTRGFYPTGRFTYRYAGFRIPYVDMQVTEDYTSDGSLTNGGTTATVGTLLRRTQTASIAATLTDARVRTFKSLSFGAALENRDFRTDPQQFLKQLDTSYARSYRFPSAFATVQYSNLQRPSVSISSEDGVSIAGTVRERLRADLPGSRSASVLGVTSLFKSLDLPGYAHHVLALRVAAAWADKQSASSFGIGGTSSNTLQLFPGYDIGDGRRTFGVRGFEPGVVYGTRAVGGTFEYRLPLLIPASGVGSLPFFLDRTSLSGFVDAAQAGCSGTETIPLVCSPLNRLNRTIASSGLELVSRASILDYDTPQTIRFGFAIPVANKTLVGASPVSVYLAYGLSF